MKIIDDPLGVSWREMRGSHIDMEWERVLFTADGLVAGYLGDGGASIYRSLRRPGGFMPREWWEGVAMAVWADNRARYDKEANQDIATDPSSMVRYQVDTVNSAKLRAALQ